MERFNGGFFALAVRGLIYMEGLIFGILRYYTLAPLVRLALQC